jgi:RNA polymerase sigma-70 factor (ECF subfamily)
MEDDLVAIHRLKAGDIGGLETLVCRYQVKAVRTAFLILHDESAAEDVAQEAFLRVFERIGRFDESRPFGPYLLRSVVNCALDAAQKASRRRQVTGSLESVEGLIQRSTTMESQAEFNALRGAIANALEKLPPRQRAAVVMRYYLQMSESEMASVLNSRPGTVKWLLNAARARLRALLDAEWRSR